MDEPMTDDTTDESREEGMLQGKPLIHLEFQPEYCWIGAFWDRNECWMNELDGQKHYFYLDLWICIIPMLPIHIMLVRVTKE